MKPGWIVLVLAAAGWVAGCQARDPFPWSRAPIKVGLLHSRSGSMEEYERSMIDAEILALEEINAAGGLLGGRRVEWVVADGRSDGPTFAREAERLLKDENVRAIFGCYTSFTRKSVRPVVERADGLLFYPMPYEGLEQSPNIVYTGAAPNQQIIPTLKWVHDHLNARSFFLIGVDSVYSRGLNRIVMDVIHEIDARTVGEEYIPYEGGGFEKVIAAIKHAKPDMIINSLSGPGNEAFCRKLRGDGLSSAEYPMIAYMHDEELVQKLPPSVLAGDYVAASYLQVVETPENHAFIERFQARFGRDRATSDVIDTAYNSVRLWAQTVQEAETDDPRAVRKLLGRQSLNAPEGVISIDGATQHAWRPSFIGRIGPDRTIRILWSSGAAIRPEPFPSSRSRPEWNDFLDALYRGWGGRWLEQGPNPRLGRVQTSISHQ